MEQATSKSVFKQGQSVIGIYCGEHFDGVLNDNCRATPDGKNIIFGITLGVPITVFGTQRSSIEIASNSTDVLYLL